MKERIITLFVFIVFVCGFKAYSQDDGIGTGWGNLFPSEPLVLNENFMGFSFFHTDNNPDSGNSENSIDPVSGDVIFGYKEDSLEIPFLGSQFSKAKYVFKQCAFAPEWSSAYAYKNASENTQNVSDGFVEISREDNVYSSVPTIRGYMILDLRQLEYVEIIQWTHSSTGGRKRGVMLEISLDDGNTWDTLRYQPGENFMASFTKDFSFGEPVKTFNEYRCEPSGYGMVWEDGIWTDNVMLRFREAGGQTPRIHDIKVHGTLKVQTAIGDKILNDFKVFSYGKSIRVSKLANIDVYNLSGKKVLSAQHTNYLQLDNVREGIYFVRAKVNDVIKTSKVLIN